jgi:hypothetical protein
MVDIELHGILSEKMNKSKWKRMLKIEEAN